MGVVARSNAAPSDKTYNDVVPTSRTVVNIRNGTTSTTTSTMSRISHWCARSDNTSGSLAPVGNRRRKKPTAFSRSVMDAPITTVTTVTRNFSSGKVTQVDTRSEPYRVPFAAITNASNGTLSNYQLRHNDNTVAEAVTKCLNRLGDRKVEVGTALAEATKSYSMMAEAAITLMKSYRNLRNGNLRAALRDLGLTQRRFYSGKSTASILLQIKYGWMPLLNDLYSGYQWFVDNEDTPLLLTARASASWTTQIDGRTSDHQFRGPVVQRGYCAITARVNVPGLRSANQLGITNPLLIAWELVPYSFVLDWFVPVGNTLQALTASSGLTFVSGYSGTSNEASVTCTAVTDYLSASSAVKSEGTCPVRYFSHKRNPFAGFPYPGLYAKQNWFNANRGATALALARSAAR